ncbi:Intracellular ribonuclease LX [Schistosoma japonicum]|nr:Intracellular ribonuclease LX [Schistosoma japonicum]
MHSILVYLSVLTISSIIQAAYKNPNWDAYLFTLTWPPTFCSSYNVTLPLNFTDFTIHGLWPIILPNITVNCTGTEKFNISLLQGLRPRLDVEWPSLKNLSRTESLWKHEFEKHGLCAVEDPKIGNQVGYFNTSLQLRAKTDLLNTLKRYNITPSNVTEYNKTVFQEVMKKAYGSPVHLSCRQNRGKGSPKNHSLEEVRFCLNRSFSHIPCPNEGKCPERFYFPPFPKHRVIYLL